MNHWVNCHFAFLVVLSIAALGSVSGARARGTGMDDMIKDQHFCFFKMLCDMGLKEEYRKIAQTYDKKTITYMNTLFKDLFPEQFKDFEVKEVFTNEFWQEKVSDIFCNRFTKEVKERFNMVFPEPMTLYLGKACQSLNFDECFKIQKATDMYYKLAAEHAEECVRVFD